MTRIALHKLIEKLPSFREAHDRALLIAAGQTARPNVRAGHSEGITRLLSLPNPSYFRAPKLHIVQGGHENGDKAALDSARERRAIEWWLVPKSAAIGDMLVIYVLRHGFYATGRVASAPPRPSRRKNRYQADIECVELIQPPISLDSIRQCVPGFAWTKYPRGICTPEAEVAERIRKLIESRRAEGDPNAASLEELLKRALKPARGNATATERLTTCRARSAAIRSMILRRAGGRCEGCAAAAPFRGMDGEPFLETHHAITLANGGADEARNVVALCPNCHRRVHCGYDGPSFDRGLARVGAGLWKELRAGRRFRTVA